MTKSGWILIVVASIWLPMFAGAKAPDVVHCGVDLDRAVLPAGGPQKAVIKVTLNASEAPSKIDRPPVNLSIVLDRSGSMSGSKIEKAKEAAIEALRRLDARDMFSLVVYDHEVETICTAQSARNAESIERKIRGIRSRGNTALFAGVSQAAAEIRKNLHDRYVHRIILLSDGLANVGPSSPADLSRLGTALLKEHITVSTVGVGNDYNEDLMTQLAQCSDGNTYFVESSPDLPRIFAAELGDVLSIVARDVILEIECAGGARPLRIIGRDGRISNNRVELKLNQLYGGQAKYALIEVEVPEGRDNELREIAVARCKYDNALTRKRESSSGQVQARYSTDKNEVNASVNSEVQHEWFANAGALAIDEAVELWDSGDRREAVRTLREKSNELKKNAGEYNLPEESQRVAEALEEEADALEKEGLDSGRRKNYRQGSYQIKSQQENDTVDLLR